MAMAPTQSPACAIWSAAGPLPTGSSIVCFEMALVRPSVVTAAAARQQQQLSGKRHTTQWQDHATAVAACREPNLRQKVQKRANGQAGRDTLPPVAAGHGTAPKNCWAECVESGSRVGGGGARGGRALGTWWPRPRLLTGHWAQLAGIAPNASCHPAGHTCDLRPSHTCPPPSAFLRQTAKAWGNQPPTGCPLCFVLRGNPTEREEWGELNFV